jgi:hypothetical protein
VIKPKFTLYYIVLSLTLVTQNLIFTPSIPSVQPAAKMSASEDVWRKDLKMIHGYPMIYAFALNWERIEEFQSTPGDIVITTYPKSGESFILKNPGLICLFCLTFFFYSCVYV